MNLLFISKLQDRPFSGTDIVIPKIVKYVSKYCNCAYLDCGNIDLDSFKDYSNYYKLKDFKKISKLPKPFNKPDLVVFQDLYIKSFIFIARELEKSNIPYVIEPHCAMTISAQNRKRLKKKIGNMLFFYHFVKHSKFVHFLTQKEYEETEANFIINNHVIIGNGIETPKRFYSHCIKSEILIIYIGRIDIYHKGLDCLIEAIGLDKEYFLKNNIRFEIYGSDFEGNVNIMERLIIKNDIRDIVTYLGPIFGKEKENKLLSCDYFIQTSRFEGLPTGVIEAFSYGVPVIITTGTNLGDVVLNNNLGFVSEFSKESVLKTIKDAINNKDKIEEISKNEINYAKKNYSWDTIAKKIVEEYRKRI